MAKERVRYVTFITPEAKPLLRQYLDLRKRKGEAFTPESPLLASADKKELTAHALRLRWRRLLRKAGLAEKSKTFHKLRMHVLRKYFHTMLEIAGVSKSFSERLLGHSGYLDDSYFKPLLGDLLREYRKAIPQLQIIEEAKLEEVRKRQLLDTAKLLGYGEDKLKRLEEVMARAKGVDEAITEFKKLEETPDGAKTTQNGNGGNGNNGGSMKVKVIRSESELI